MASIDGEVWSTSTSMQNLEVREFHDPRAEIP